jgi:hypothetical protein
MKRLFLAAVLFALSASLAFSFDFGLLADQKIEAEEKTFSYTPAFTPWLSWNGGRGLSLYFSGVFSFKYRHYDDDMSGNDGWNKYGLLPEFGRFALDYRSGRIFRVEAGRIGYSDALGFAASGLFDGFSVKVDLPSGSINAGVWYTGLLYKETAKIIMTAGDVKKYAEPWDWDNPDRYFASRRLLGAFRWEAPLGEFHSLFLETLAQFDLTGNDEALHSQYGEILAEFFPLSMLGIGAGALLEVMENKDGEFSAAFGWLARLKTDIPGALNDGLDLTVKFTSGQWNDAFTVFTPLSSPAQGAVFSGTLSGLALVSASYTARLHRALLLESGMAYFFRTFDDPLKPDKYLYGGEIRSSFAWQPLDDLRLTLGGGVFFPALGNLYPDDTDPQWKFSAGLWLAF